MNSLLEEMALAVWRASWQGAALAVIVAGMLWLVGQRIAPRWRFLLWGVVLIRLLVVITPASPWSLFNLAGWDRPPAVAASQNMVQPESEPDSVILPAVQHLPVDPSVMAGEGRESGAAESAPPDVKAVAIHIPQVEAGRTWSIAAWQILSVIWLAGCLGMTLHVARGVMALQQRLRACRPVENADLLNVLFKLSRQMGLRRPPGIWVTPDCVSPCLTGFWKPRIVLPEMLLTQPDSNRLQHVLAHELAHLSRGDQWTNWFLLAARILHWFNPAAWWTVREMLSEREAACDELACDVLGDREKTEYASTIVDLAASLSPSSLAPGLVGLFSSRGRLQARLERLLLRTQRSLWRTLFALGLLLSLAICGLTDSIPRIQAQGLAQPAPEPAAAAPVAKGQFTITGVCQSRDGTRLARVSVRLYRSQGPLGKPEEIARTVSDAQGNYTFGPVDRPRSEWHLEHLEYSVFGFLENRAVGSNYVLGNPGPVNILIPDESTTCWGRILDQKGQPVVGAVVMRFSNTAYQPVDDVLSAVTSASGFFEIKDAPLPRKRDGSPYPIYLTIKHPDHSRLSTQFEKAEDLLIALPGGCEVTGNVFDEVTGQPAAGAVVTLEILGDGTGTQIHVATDPAGNYRAVVSEGRYKVLVAAKDRVGLALNGRECLAGEQLKLPQLKLTGGGWISGQVLNSITGQPVILSEQGHLITLGLFGPSIPYGNAIRQIPQTQVDDQGRFTLRAAAGENFPYFVNTRGDRMAWDIERLPPVIVREGETTVFNMLITPPAPPADKLEASRKLLASFPQQPRERTERILEEFRKLSKTVDETELWCLLMRDLVGIGKEALPQICEELDKTKSDRAIRRLAFALRAIGDPRAVPALVRALPRTLLPSSSDYGLIVEDAELTAFMQAHDLDDRGRGIYFSVDRPVREVIGALQSLTKQSFVDDSMQQISLSEDPRRQTVQRRIFSGQAQRWQTWWEENWQSLTNDTAYAKCHLVIEAPPVLAAPGVPGPGARLNGTWSGYTLSPAAQEGRHAHNFYDLDTGLAPAWPAHIPRDETAANSPELAVWAAQSGVDLMCVSQRNSEGSDVYVLRAFGMKVREITSREMRNLDTSLAAGQLPEGRPVEGLLMHYDQQRQQHQPEANAAFIFMTAEGNWGVIETTDRIISAEDITGQVMSTPGVGFHLGIKFDLTEIIP